MKFYQILILIFYFLNAVDPPVCDHFPCEYPLVKQSCPNKCSKFKFSRIFFVKLYYILEKMLSEKSTKITKIPTTSTSNTIQIYFPIYLNFEINMTVKLLLLYINKISGPAVSSAERQSMQYNNIFYLIYKLL